MVTNVLTDMSSDQWLISRQIAKGKPVTITTTKYQSIILSLMELNRRKSQVDSREKNGLTTSAEKVSPEQNGYLSYFSRLLFVQTSSSSYFLTRIVFIRLLGLVYTFSFLAAYHQTPVLIGYQGLYPSHLYMERMKERYGLWQSPSLFYFLPAMDTSDLSLRTICALGTLLGLFLLVTGRCNAIILFILWCFHTSLLNIGQLFYG